MTLSTTALVALAMNSMLAGRPLPLPGDALEFELTSGVRQKAKVCQAQFSLNVEAKIENSGTLIVSSRTQQNGGPTGCGKPSHALKSWFYNVSTNELFRVVECKTEDPSTCVSREPTPGDEWQSPEQMGTCENLGSEPMTGPTGRITALHWQCDNSASLPSGKSISNFWINEALYPAYPIVRMKTHIEIPAYEFTMEVEQVLRSIKRARP